MHIVRTVVLRKVFHLEQNLRSGESWHDPGLWVFGWMGVFENECGLPYDCHFDH